MQYYKLFKFSLVWILFLLIFTINTAYASNTIADIYSTVTPRQKMGTLSFTENSNGVIIQPYLNNLTPGIHGLRLLTINNCNNKLANNGIHGKVLPPLSVNEQGSAQQPILAQELKLNNFINHTLIIYEDWKNIPSQDFPFAAGKIIACGKII